MSDRVYNVLFLCSLNSARSIIAEAVLRKIGKGRFQAFSAGSNPAPDPMPAVLERLEALNFDTSNLSSKSWSAFTAADAQKMDFVIAMCDTLTGQQCPDFGDHVVTGSWPFPDPAKFEGTDVERTAMLNELIGMIERRLDIFINLPFSSLDKISLQARIDELGQTIKGD